MFAENGLDVNGEVIVEYNVMVPMRDGVRLSTDVYRPKAPGKYPVVMVRHPYDNGSGESAFNEGTRWAQNGYVFLRQDVRGRYDSEGARFYPYKHEAQDGYDAQEWAGKQSWSNGKVGMSGISYLATVQWFSAPLRSKYLKSIAPGMSPYNYYHDVAYTGGAFRLAGRASWGTLMGARTNQSSQHDWNDIIWHLPLRTLDVAAIGRDLPHWQDWIAHPSYDEYWEKFDAEAKVSDIDVPAYSIAGWYDAMLRGNLVSYEGLKKKGHSARTRKNQKLLIGPWSHSPNPSTKVGEIEFGDVAKVDFIGETMRWHDHWLKGEKTGLMDEAPVRIFVMGENVWRDEQEWPLARAEYTKYYLHSEGRANSSSGDGTLSTDAPTSEEAVDTYTYDPANPVPSVGGSMTAIVASGPRDQSEVEKRDDVLVFSTPVLTEDTEVTGPITVTLYAESSAVDTDFTAKLVDVHPDGKAYNLMDGIVRARYRDSFTDPTLIKPGKVYEYTIDLWATSNLFKKGHRIRLDISSSSFPRFNRNPNTGNKFGETTELKVAHQKIYHTEKYPSHITLPIIPR